VRAGKGGCSRSDSMLETVDGFPSVQAFFLFLSTLSERLSCSLGKGGALVRLLLVHRISNKSNLHPIPEGAFSRERSRRRQPHTNTLKIPKSSQVSEVERVPKQKKILSAKMGCQKGYLLLDQRCH
jgi:hypothetical protein